MKRRRERKRGEGERDRDRERQRQRQRVGGVESELQVKKAEEGRERELNLFSSN